MNVVKEKAYAKINLYLDVTGRREDGFHDIESVMTAVSLCDDLTVAFAPANDTRIFVDVIGAPFIPKDERNLAVKAAKVFMEYCGFHGHVKIVLKKNIPVCAGLGGGSSDAAAVLRALNRIHKYPLSQKMLIKLAAGIGSDVPFCVCGKTALCTGRGDCISPIPFSGSLVCVIGIAKERMQTPEAYGNLDKLYAGFDGSVLFGHRENLESLLSFFNGKDEFPALFNVFESAVFPVCQGAAAMKEIMLTDGALASLLSGSGPAVFGIFPESESALACQSHLISLGYSAYVCYSAGLIDRPCKFP